ncbi:MAG: AMP-binding protein [Planctomycetota bacterium]
MLSWFPLGIQGVVFSSSETAGSTCRVYGIEPQFYDEEMILPENNSYDSRRAIEQLPRSTIEALQLHKLNLLLERILPHNSFYETKLSQINRPVQQLEQLDEFPFTFKNELVGTEDSEGFAANLTWPVERYTRMHRTSGTRGRPMVVLDTPEDWHWWMQAWDFVLDSAQLTESDRVLMAFSFGPFIGFWSAFDAAVRRGALVVPGGGMQTLARLELMRTIGATVVFCTPSYALHMAEVARDNQIEVADLSVRAIVVAGEPGGSIPSIRDQIESFWQAKVIDHSGASEAGPWGYADPEGRGVYVNEFDYIPEFISIEDGSPAEDGEVSELVLTCLGRDGSPVIRYRTGDLVRPTWKDDQENRFVLLQGGVLGRTDDMMIIRGVNIFPSSIEQILRSFPEIIEYRMTAFKDGSMDQLRVEIEDRLGQPERVAEELKLRLGLRVDVELVEVGALPRFEAKGKRFVDQRRAGN